MRVKKASCENLAFFFGRYINLLYIYSMKKISIGKVTISQQIKAIKKDNREIELENQAGFKSTNKIHKSKKTYSRKNKHKK